MPLTRFTAAVAGLLVAGLVLLRERAHRRRLLAIIAVAAIGALVAEALVRTNTISLEGAGTLLAAVLWLCVMGALMLTAAGRSHS